MIFIGVDPGMSGAIAVLGDINLVEVYDTPTLKVGTKTEYDLAAIFDAIDTMREQSMNVVAAVERQQAFPKQGVVSSFSTGFGFGMWCTVFASRSIPLNIVGAKTWQGEMLRDMQKTKDASRQKARQLYPLLAEELKLKSHHNRSDALLIASWLKRISGPN